MYTNNDQHNIVITTDITTKINAELNLLAAVYTDMSANSSSIVQLQLWVRITTLPYPWSPLQYHLRRHRL